MLFIVLLFIGGYWTMKIIKNMRYLAYIIIQ